MAVSDNIKRLQDAKAAIKSAIESKGGSVSGTIDKYASAILALPTGGELVTKTATNTNSGNLSFTGVTKEPKFWAVFATASYTTSSYYCIMAARGEIGTGNRAVLAYRSSGGYQHANITATYSGSTLTISSTGSNSSTSGTWRATSYQLIAVC